jgi:transcriptional regulator with AAA-type ATPase domain
MDISCTSGRVSIFDAGERARAVAISRLSFANPFLPERIEHERDVLGDDFQPAEMVWSVRAGSAESPNVPKLAARAEALAEMLRGRLLSGTSASAEDIALYEDVVLYVLYSRYENELFTLVVAPPEGERAGPVGCWAGFASDAERFFRTPGVRSPSPPELAHLFACFFQVRRAFHHTFRFIVGASMPAARLRGAVWQSIFTHDMRRYRRSLYAQMHDVTTLVTGPSGTGKELVARAIAFSRYIPFDHRTRRFASDFESAFHPLNLSALSPTLIESELFGHRRGAFTGALSERAGWLEVAGPHGTVFLDEIGELDAAIQVKLLRVLQERTFQRLGDTKAIHFAGKIVAATNRDLAAEMAAGRFREDFYYRLCSDRVETPSLAAQLAGAPDELGRLVLFLADRIAGPAEGAALAREVEAWIERHLGRGYTWPGNVRELEQCVRNVLVRKEYRPERKSGVLDELVDGVRAKRFTADELLNRYCTLVYAETGSYVETARRLKLDRRTVRARVDSQLLGELHAVLARGRG